MKKKLIGIFFCLYLVFDTYGDFDNSNIDIEDSFVFEGFSANDTDAMREKKELWCTKKVNKDIEVLSLEDLLLTITLNRSLFELDAIRACINKYGDECSNTEEKFESKLQKAIYIINNNKLFKWFCQDKKKMKDEINNRANAYQNLGYDIYLDEKGELRKQDKWWGSSWRSQENLETMCKKLEKSNLQSDEVRESIIFLKYLIQNKK